MHNVSCVSSEIQQEISQKHVHWLIIKIRMEEVVEGEVLKICKLLKFKDYRKLRNIFFEEARSNMSCVSSEIQQKISQKHVSTIASFID